MTWPRTSERRTMKQKQQDQQQTPAAPNGSGAPETEAPRITTRFPLGRVVITANAERELVRDDVTAALARHAAGDWGECGSHDWQENELSLREGLRLFSVYRDRQDVKFWIITEADRSATTILLPNDY